MNTEITSDKNKTKSEATLPLPSNQLIEGATAALVARDAGSAGDQLNNCRIASQEAKPEVDQPQTTLATLETVIARGLSSQDEVASALLNIHEQKLFRPNYRSFKNYLKERWAMGRSRGYQLLHFARRKRLSTMVGAEGPDNERQARTRNMRPREDDPVMRAMNYLANAFYRLPAHRRPEFVKDLQGLLREMEQTLDVVENSTIGGRILTPNSNAEVEPHLAELVAEPLSQGGEQP